MLDYRVQTFLCACRHMNFTRAAEELHITQPAVSKHIRDLERFYGSKLFRSEGKRLQLTPAGAVLLSTMTAVQNDESTLIKRMRQTGSETALALGVTLTIGEYVLSPMLARYLELHPDRDVRVEYANTSRLLELLHGGKLDFILVEGYYKAEEYETLHYRTEPFLPICAAVHRFVHPGPVRELEDLLGERLLVREPGSGTRDILEKNLALKNLSVSSFAHHVEVASMHTIVDLLVRDCGVAFLYETAAARELAAGALRTIPLAGFHMEHDFTFLWNRSGAFSQEYEAMCREWAGF